MPDHVVVWPRGQPRTVAWTQTVVWMLQTVKLQLADITHLCRICYQQWGPACKQYRILGDIADFVQSLERVVVQGRCHIYSQHIVCVRECSLASAVLMSSSSASSDDCKYSVVIFKYIFWCLCKYSVDVIFKYIFWCLCKYSVDVILRWQHSFWFL